ncbi:MAG: S8 family serine peptidase [Pirellulales bacterium]|nr:S8 family serine peptidase [Pirellulales bacterium]
MLPVVSPAWFQDFTGPGTVSHVNPAPFSAAQVGISGAATDSDASGAEFSDWIVRFTAESLQGVASADQTVSLLAGGGVQFEVLRGLGLVGQVLVRSSGAASDNVAGWLDQNTHVASYELDVVQKLQATPDDPQYERLWGLENAGQTGGTAGADIEAEAAWDISTGAGSIVVGVIDTGVDYTHPDLAANIWTNPGEIAGNGFDDDGNGFVDDVHGYDFVNNDGDPMDDHNHGTHVAGTIAAEGNNGSGIVGVNWSSSIMGLKFLSASGSGYTSDAVRAVNYATMMRTQYGVNVRLTNNSWGGGGYSSALAAAIAAGGDAGMLFVAAAGNDGANNDLSPHYPSDYELPNVLSVAASDDADNLAWFSNYGVSTVHLAAPGVSIYSTITGGGYASYSGTSMATPHVSGVAALAWSVTPTATVAEIRGAILQGTDVLASLSGTTTTGGRLNAYHTLQLVGSPDPEQPVVGSLLASPRRTAAGMSVAIAAHSVSDPDGSVSAVYFYRDTDSNGVWGETDALLGIDTTVIDSEAGIVYDTTSLTPGTYGLFARAVDNDLNWSDARTTFLEIVAPDDHGDNAATATLVAVGSTATGTIDSQDDQDWFALDAVAGAGYCFTTELLTLTDSMLMLYDQDGVTLLAWDDDGGPGYASSIFWTADASGTYFLSVLPYPGEGAGDYVLNLLESTDDHGDNAPSATVVFPGSSTGGVVDHAGDVDFFAFDAVAGRRYTIETTLLALNDSVLSLYGQDGSTRIGYDDDSGESLGSRLVWAAPASGTYYAAVEAFDSEECGSYLLELRQSAPQRLGTVDFHAIVVPGSADLDQWYRLETAHDGWLTIETDFTGAYGGVELELFGGDLRELAVSSSYSGADRIDWDVHAGETFYVSVIGSVSGGTLRLANLVEQDGSTVTVCGTDFNDELQFTAGELHQVVINDVSYSFDCAGVTQIAFGGGTGSDSATLLGTAATETAVMAPNSATLSGSQYTATVSNVAEILIRGGGGNDAAHLYDSAGDDTFIATPDYARLYGDGFCNQVEAFPTLAFYATGGGIDQAYSGPSQPSLSSSEEGSAADPNALSVELPGQSAAAAESRPRDPVAAAPAIRTLAYDLLYEAASPVSGRRWEACSLNAGTDSHRAKLVDWALEADADWLAA